MQKLIYVAAVRVYMVRNPRRHSLPAPQVKPAKRLDCQLMRPAFLPGGKVIELAVTRQA